MKNIENCPICKESKFKSFLNCKDYTYSNETFNLDQCTNCGFVFTNPIPKESEIGKYYQSEEYISHSNTSKGLINILYQIVRKYTIPQKVNLIKSLGAGKKLLDIGCGTAEFLNACQKKGYEVVGVEPSDVARRKALENYGINLHQEQALTEMESNSFNFISMWHVLEHVYPLQSRVETIKRLLKKEGKAVIAVPNRNAFDAAHYGAYWAGYDVPRHLYHFRPQDIKTLFESHGLTLIKTLPMKFDAFYVSMLSEKYKGKGSLLKALQIGLLSNLKAKPGQTYTSQIYVFKK